MTTENTESTAQNTETAATSADENAGHQPTPKADMAAMLFGDDRATETNNEANGEEGKEDGAPSEDDPSKQTEKADDKGAKTEGAPEAYADFTMPEGVQLNEELAGELKTLAKELNLSQENAQRLADLGAKQAAKLAEQPAHILAEARAEWEKQTRNDKEFGGQALDANLATAKKALDAYGSPELKTLLRESALGNHPDVIRLFYRVGKAMSEDTMVRGQSGTQPKAKSRAEVLYGDNN